MTTKQSSKQPTKKAVVATKRTAVKNTTKKQSKQKRSKAYQSARQQEYHSMRRAFFMSLAAFALAVSTIVVMSFLAAHTIVAEETNNRLTRIKAVYANLNLGDDYTVTSTNVFGDKRVYESDSSRTYSSEIDYLHGDTVSNTVADVDAKIKESGFAFIDEPYPGSSTVQYHYKSSEGVYIRLTVGSKQYYDALTNATVMEQDTTSLLQTVDTNAAPAQVTIKVNLDDNNK